MKPNFYIQLDYDAYKHLEDQLARFKELEKLHVSVDGYYHKSYRIEVGPVVLEFQGPLVRQPLTSTERE